MEVRALIGRYLKHTRIYRFANNGNRELFIGSADLMPRNLNRRVEVLTPIKDSEIKDELDHYVTLNLHDRYGSFRVLKENMNELIRHRSDIQFPLVKELISSVRSTNKQAGSLFMFRRGFTYSIPGRSETVLFRFSRTSPRMVPYFSTREQL